VNSQPLANGSPSTPLKGSVQQNVQNIEKQGLNADINEVGGQ
jgi:hypothetical protein